MTKSCSNNTSSAKQKLISRRFECIINEFLNPHLQILAVKKNQ